MLFTLLVQIVTTLLPIATEEVHIIIQHKLTCTLTHLDEGFIATQCRRGPI